MRTANKSAQCDSKTGFSIPECPNPRVYCAYVYVAHKGDFGALQGIAYPNSEVGAV